MQKSIIFASIGLVIVVLAITKNVTPHNSEHFIAAKSQLGAKLTKAIQPSPHDVKENPNRSASEQIKARVEKAVKSYCNGSLSRMEWEQLWKDLALEDWRLAVTLMSENVPDDDAACAGIVEAINFTQSKDVLDYTGQHLNSPGATLFAIRLLQKFAVRKDYNGIELLSHVARNTDPVTIGITMGYQLSTRIDDQQFVAQCLQRIEGLSQGDWLDSFTESALLNVPASPDQTRALLAAYLQNSNASSSKVLEGIAASYAMRDPKMVAETLSTSNNPAASQAAALAMGSWSAKQPEEAGNWLNAQKNTLNYEWLVAGYVVGSRNYDPDASSVWLGTIKNSDARGFAQEQVAIPSE